MSQQKRQYVYDENTISYYKSDNYIEIDDKNYLFHVTSKSLSHKGEKFGDWKKTDEYIVVRTNRPLDIITDDVFSVLKKRITEIYEDIEKNYKEEVSAVKEQVMELLKENDDIFEYCDYKDLIDSMINAYPCIRSIVGRYKDYSYEETVVNMLKNRYVELPYEQAEDMSQVPCICHRLSSITSICEYVEGEKSMTEFRFIDGSSVNLNETNEIRNTAEAIKFIWSMGIK